MSNVHQLLNIITGYALNAALAFVVLLTYSIH